MGRHKLVTASNASAYVLLTVGAVVLINLIGTRVFGRIDLTENHVYTLAPGSKEIVSKLPDYLTVKAYISKNDLPPEMKSVANYVTDLLDEYIPTRRASCASKRSTRRTTRRSRTRPPSARCRSCRCR
jgi:ABC-type uncharacterized transport system involved in gliding motility auxiliary subunit